MSQVEEYSFILKTCIKSLQTGQYLLLQETGQILDEQQHIAELTKFEQIVKEYCNVDNDYQRFEKALNLVREILSSDDENHFDIDELYKQKFAEQQIDENFKNNKIWTTFYKEDCSIREVEPKSKRKPRVSQSYYEDIDDSLRMSSKFQIPIDPIRKTLIKKPIRNSKCNHIYDKETIYDYIGQSKKRTPKCPYVGCENNKLIPQDLIADTQLERQIQEHLNSRNSAENNDSDSSN